jgi:hypothetical protein
VISGPGAGRGLLASNAFVALVLLALTFSVAVFSVRERQPLGDIARLTDEWYMLGLNIVTTGTLGLADEPILLRAPGYPFFIAAALRLIAGRPEALNWGFWDRGQHAVYLAQALVLGGTAAVLYLWLAGFLRRRVAFVSALAFGLNPYSIVLAGLVHYDVLHLFCVVSGCWALGSAHAAPGSSGASPRSCGPSPSSFPRSSCSPCGPGAGGRGGRPSGPRSCSPPASAPPSPRGRPATTRSAGGSSR